MRCDWYNRERAAALVEKIFQMDICSSSPGPVKSIAMKLRAWLQNWAVMVVSWAWSVKFSDCQRGLMAPRSPVLNNSYPENFTILHANCTEQFYRGMKEWRQFCRNNTENIKDCSRLYENLTMTGQARGDNTTMATV